MNFIRKSGLIPRSSAPSVINQNLEKIGIKPDGIINFLSNEAPVKSSNAYRYLAACRGELHFYGVFGGVRVAVKLADHTA